MASKGVAPGGGSPLVITSLQVGDRVMTLKDKLLGTVRFVGDTQFATGQWIGIELDEARGKNDGSVNDVSYFACTALHGLFVRDAQVRALTAAEDKASGARPPILSAPSPNPPPPPPFPSPSSPPDSELVTSSSGGGGGGLSTSTSTSGSGSGSGIRSRLEELKEKRNAMLAKVRETGAKAAEAPLPAPPPPGDIKKSPVSTAPPATEAATAKAGGRRPSTTSAIPLETTAATTTAGSAQQKLPGTTTTTMKTTSSRASLSSASTSLSTTAAARRNSGIGAPRPLTRTSISSSSAAVPKPTVKTGSTSQQFKPPSGADSGRTRSQGGDGGQQQKQQPQPQQGLPPAAVDEEGEEDAHSVRSAFSDDGTVNEEADNAPARTPSTSLAEAVNVHFDGGGIEASASRSGHLSRMSLDSSRRSLGGTEGEATATQVAGLKTLLARKNADLDALKQKAEEGAEAIKTVKALKERADKVEAELSGERERAQRLEVEVEELRKEAARAAEVRAKGEKEAKDTDGVKARCSELEALVAEKQVRLADLEMEVRGLRLKVQHGQEEEKAKWAELAKEKAAGAGAVHRVAELEAQVAALHDTIELLTLDKEQLIIDKELLEEKAEELGMELETARLELETADAGRGEGGGAQDEDSKAINEQNVKLRAALKKLQEISQAEKAELLRKQRELERELSHAEQAARQAVELRNWKASKEPELMELREMVEVGHAYESMVESLTTKNLELEQKVSDLKIAISELEVAQELSEELEAQQAEEAAALRKEVERAAVVLSEKDAALRQSEARLADREKTLQRFRALVSQLTAERDELREKADQRAAALGEARGLAQDVLGQVQSLRVKAKMARGRMIGEALAKVEAANANAKVSRFTSFLPREIVDREAGAVEGDLALARLANKATMALEVLGQGYGPWLLPTAERQAESGGLRQETPSERVERCAYESHIAECLARGLQVAYFIILRIEHPAFDTSPEAGLSLSAEAGSLLLPLERVVDELLRLVVEEGGVPVHQMRVADLEDAVAAAEAFSLLRDGDHTKGLSQSLWAQAGAAANLALLPMLTMASLAQACTLLEELGEPESKVEPLRTLARETAKLPSRLKVVAGSLSEMLPTAGYDDAEEAATMQGLSHLQKALVSVTSVLGSLVGEGPSSEAASRQASEALIKLQDEWRKTFGTLKAGSIRVWEGREAVFSYATMGTGGSNTPCIVRSMRVRKQLLEAMELVPALNATKESERRLTQEIRDKDKQHEVLRAKVDSLESLLQDSALTEQKVEAMRSEVEELSSIREKLEQENHVLSEALEVVQQQADTLETENRRLKANRLNHSSSSGYSSPINANGGAGGGRHMSSGEMPLVASAALSVMEATLKHVNMELAHWRAQATHSILKDLKPLVPVMEAVCVKNARHRVGRAAVPEATGQEEPQQQPDNIDQLRWSIQEALRLQAKVTAMRCSRKVVSLTSTDGRKRPRTMLLEQQVAAGQIARECAQLRERVNKALGHLIPNPIVKAAATPASGASTDIGRLLGRLRIGGDGAGEGEGAIPVVVGETQLRYLNSVIAAV